jgi:hypothetical protein
LLQGVGQFVGQQEAARSRVRVILVLIEHDVAPNRVGGSVNSLSRLGRFCIGMHTHPAEIVAEARLHKGACCCVERLAG